jgi:hypothetical protein
MRSISVWALLLLETVGFVAADGAAMEYWSTDVLHYSNTPLLDRSLAPRPLPV